jgi:hypothetical protein
VHAEGGLTCRASNSAWTKRITDAIARLDHEIGRFTAAIGTGGDLASLVEALRARERQRAELQGQLARLAPTRNLTRDASAWRRAARARLKDWRDSMQRKHPGSPAGIVDAVGRADPLYAARGARGLAL